MAIYVGNLWFCVFVCVSVIVRIIHSQLKFKIVKQNDLSNDFFKYIDSIRAHSFKLCANNAKEEKKLIKIDNNSTFAKTIDDIMVLF